MAKKPKKKSQRVEDSSGVREQRKLRQEGKEKKKSRWKGKKDKGKPSRQDLPRR